MSTRQHIAWHCRALLVMALLLAGLTGPSVRAQAVDWFAVFSEITEPVTAGPQSRVDDDMLAQLERMALDDPMPAMPRPASSPAPAVQQTGRPQLPSATSAAPAEQSAPAPSRAPPGLSAYEALTAGSAAAAEPAPTAERPPDLAAYGQLADQFGNRVVTRTTQGVSTFRSQFRRLAHDVPRVPAMFIEMLRNASPTGEAHYFLEVAGVIVATLLGGRALIGVLGPTIGLPIMRAAQRRFKPEGMAGKLPVLATRVVTTTIVVFLGFGITGLIGIAVLDGRNNEAAETTLILATGFYMGYAIIDAMWRMVISPYLPEYRLPHIADSAARKLYIWLSVCVFVGLFGESLIVWMEQMSGAPELIVISSIVLRLIAVGVIIAMILVNRGAIRSAILMGRRPEDAGWVPAAAALLAPPVVILYFVAAWLEGSVRLVLQLRQGLPLFIGPFVVLMTALLVFAIGSYAVEVYFKRARLRAALNRAAAEAAAAQFALERAEAAEAARERAAMDTPELQRLRDEATSDAEGDDDEEGAGNMPVLPDSLRREEAERPMPRERHGMQTFEDLGHRVASLIAAGVGGYMMVRIWAGPGVFQEGGIGDWVDDIVDKLLLGYIAYHGARIWLDQKIEEEGGDMPMAAEPGDEGGGASASSRLATLLPLLRSFVLAVIGATVLILVAMDFGVNVAPLFAGAGIVGLALGFGAQTLVRDILSGVFFLLDDAFRKGEYIDVGEVKGTVEKISVRSFQLRHHLGALNTIPFGEIKHLTNFSRDWVMMKLPLRLTYDTDVDKVRKLIKKLGERLLDHPTEGHKFVQPLKSQGVYMMEDSAMIIRVKFMTRPGDQWTTRKLVYQEIRNLFEREGIKFAHREVTVRTPDLPANATPEQIRLAGAAARQAIEENPAEAMPLSAVGEAR